MLSEEKSKIFVEKVIQFMDKNNLPYAYDREHDLMYIGCTYNYYTDGLSIPTYRQYKDNDSVWVFESVWCNSNGEHDIVALDCSDASNTTDIEKQIVRMTQYCIAREDAEESEWQESMEYYNELDDEDYQHNNSPSI